MPAKSMSYKVWDDGEDEEICRYIMATCPRIAAIRYCMTDKSPHAMLRGVWLNVSAPGEEPVRMRVLGEVTYSAACEHDIVSSDRSQS
jgi:hypothetical protein